jgi:hypothetical protein
VCIDPSVITHIAKFLYIYIYKVAGVAVIFEVQRSSRSEARKEELRKQEFEVTWQ